MYFNNIVISWLFKLAFLPYFALKLYTTVDCLRPQTTKKRTNCKTNSVGPTAQHYLPNKRLKLKTVLAIEKQNILIKISLEKISNEVAIPPVTEQ